MSSSSPPKHAAAPAPQPPWVRRRRRRSIGLVVLVVLLLVAGVTVWRWSQTLAPVSGPTVTASSTQTGSSPRNAVDTGSASSTGSDWESDGETSGAWLELSWRQPHELRQIIVVRNPIGQAGVTDGFLSFGDGSFLQVKLSPTARATTIPITPRSVDRVRFTASAVSAGARNVIVSEFLALDAGNVDAVETDDAPDGNEAVVATATASPGAPDPQSLQDGLGAPGAAGAGTDWVVASPVGAWVQFDWKQPEELAGVEVVGSAHSSTSLGSATLTFGDGATLPIGGVLADPGRPTIVSFMPRVTQSVRLTIDGVKGAGPLALSELRTYRRGVSPRRAPSTVAQPPDPAAVACIDPAAPRPATGLVARCPVTSSVVDRNVSAQVAVAAGYSQVTATVWPADASVPALDPVSAPVDAAGNAVLNFDVTGVPPGPFTVQFGAAGPGGTAPAVYFQLYRSSAGSANAPVDDTAAPGEVGPPAQGRTLAYAEEFDHPLSISRTGADADYAAAKPVMDGTQDFGDAIFADPGQGLGGPRVVDNRYLRIDVGPDAPGGADPQGWGRTHVGGLLASARPGGSGFSAQYGYFEARMLAPAAPGTWPAFWTLPADNLVAATPAVAEVDAVELYGRDPVSACQSTHGYRDGRDTGLAQCGRRFPTERSAFSWHTYGASITPTAITFFVDGQEVAHAPQVPGGGSPMFFLVNLALGGGWPIDLSATQDRASLYVDYVRVYV